MKKKSILSFMLALSLVLTACNNGKDTNETKEETKVEKSTESAEETKTDDEKKDSDQSKSELKDGTYEIKESGHNASIDFEIKIADNKISEINVLKSFETPGVTTKALETDLPESIIENQSTAVDTITGATVSSRALIRAVEKAIGEAGGKAEDYRVEIEKPEPKEIEDEADIIVVGGGGAGLSAAITAAEKGSSVIIVEKAGYVGGNTLISGGIYNTPDPELQHKQEMTPGLRARVEEAIDEEPVNDAHKEMIEALKKDYDDYNKSGEKGIFDSAAWYALQTWNGGDKVADEKLVKTLAYNAKDGLDWLHDMGWEYNDQVQAGAGAMYPRTHSVDKPLGTGYIDAYMNYIDNSDKVKVVYNTRADELIKDGDKVVGVKAKDKGGNTYTFNANKSVILSTGGFAGNKELINKYNDTGKWPDLSDVKSSNLPTIEGDGIVMAEDVGAGLRDMDQIQLLYLGNLNVASITKGTFQPKGADGLIYVNKEGKRFVREDGRRDEISLAFLDQTDGIGYTVECADSGVTEETTDLGGVPIKELIDDGTVFYGETLEEAAKAAGIDPVELQKTVDQLNKLVDEKASTDEFGRSVFTTKLENGPWYIIPKVPAIHHTMGGVVIDEECHVLDKDGNRIEGLFAAGEIVGGIHGANRLGGNALVDTVVFGRIAGEKAAE